MIRPIPAAGAALLAMLTLLAAMGRADGKANPVALNVVFGDEPVRITSKRSASSYSMFNAIQIVPLR
ncbi:MAG: hypothetical protein GXY83_07640 [Rhodopirellula sp.]|nr:hypothetical protein [Rhodopirellula sp.]